MVMLRNADVFVKPRADLRSKSVSGGAITLIAGTTAALLFVGQLYVYIVGTTRHTLHLTESLAVPMLPTMTLDPFQSRMYDLKGKMPLKLHVTFPHIPCQNLEVKLNNAPLEKSDFDFKFKNVDKRRPNPIELNAMGDPNLKNSGCTVYARLRVPIVAGHVTVTMTRQAWSEALNHLMLQAHFTDEQRKREQKKQTYNMTHYIHTVQFGKRYPHAAAYPLEGRMHRIDNHMGGIALENVQVKLVPTVYSGFFSTQKSYQLSVVDHTVQPETMVSQGVAMTPGLAIGYDVSPLAVHHDDGRDNLFVFLSSLVSIVGGVFVTVSLLTGCLVHSASAVAKKVD